MKVEYKNLRTSLYTVSRILDMLINAVKLWFSCLQHIGGRRSDLSMSRDKGGKENLSTDGTNFGVKVNIKIKIFNCYTEVTDIIKNNINVVLK